MNGLFTFLAAGFLLLPGHCRAADATSSDASSCTAYLQQGATSENGHLGPGSLIELLDIGEPHPAYQPGLLTLSPDGQRLAFPVRRDDIGRDRSCSAVMIIDLQGRRPPVIAGAGSEPVMSDFDYWGLVIRENKRKLTLPSWSSDGRSIAFERRQEGITRLWVYNADGSGGRPLPCTTGGVDSFTWHPTKPLITAHMRQKVWKEPEAAAGKGHHFDDRFMPFLSDTPFERTAADRDDIAISVANDSCDAIASANKRASYPSETDETFTGPGSSLASIVRESPASGDRVLTASVAEKLYRCDQSECGYVDAAFWLGPRSLAIVAKTGWAKSQTSILLWRPGQKPRRLRVAEDVLTGCALVHADLLCAQESALSPRKIVAISLRNGRERQVFEPNPEFPRADLNPSTRLRWTNAFGVESFGDLVVPQGSNDHPLPLIVTTYTSRGFLRGATGDEYPVQLMARRGFAVLNINRPKDVEPAVSNSGAEFEWRDRSSFNSSIDVIVRRLIKAHVVDENRIGISGLSDGATAVTFAVLNGSLFKAAALSSCCVEPMALYGQTSQGTRNYFQAKGYPGMSITDQRAWAPMSMIISASKMTTPLLMQLGSEELRLATISFAALKEAGAPVDMYVYPGEGHIKYRPRHRLTVYRRNLAWFELWLNGRRDETLVTREDLDRWESLVAAAN